MRGAQRRFLADCVLSRSRSACPHAARGSGAALLLDATGLGSNRVAISAARPEATREYQERTVPPGRRVRCQPLEATVRRRQAASIHVAVSSEGIGQLSHESILAALAGYEQDLEKLRYGSFRGVVKDGRLVLFAIEQEWRPAVERKRAVS